MSRFSAYVVAALLGLPVVSMSRDVGPSFVADGTFKASGLNGWHPSGQADWRTGNDELIGKGKGPAGSGWLFSDKAYQDVAFYGLLRCSGPCNTGVLLRAEKTADGTKGVLLNVTDTGVSAYSVVLDADGKEKGRTDLRTAGGQIRFAPHVNPNSGARGPGPGFTLPPAPPGVTLPITRPQQGIRAGDWNEVELLLDADILRMFGNDGGVQTSVATPDMTSYGPIALFVGSGSEVHFKSIAYKDLAVKVWPAEQVGAHFKKQELNPFYYGWSAAAADFNKDGVLDVVSGPYYYVGPDYTTAREIYPAQAYNASTEYSNDDWVQHAYDFTGDGWPDVLTTSHAGGGKVGAVLYVNPKGESRRWEKHQVVPN